MGYENRTNRRRRRRSRIISPFAVTAAILIAASSLPLSASSTVDAGIPGNATRIEHITVQEMAQGEAKTEEVVQKPVGDAATSDSETTEEEVRQQHLEAENTKPTEDDNQQSEQLQNNAQQQHQEQKVEADPVEPHLAVPVVTTHTDEEQEVRTSTTEPLNQVDPDNLKQECSDCQDEAVQNDVAEHQPEQEEEENIVMDGNDFVQYEGVKEQPEEETKQEAIVMENVDASDTEAETNANAERRDDNNEPATNVEQDVVDEAKKSESVESDHATNNEDERHVEPEKPAAPMLDQEDASDINEDAHQATESVVADHNRAESSESKEMSAETDTDPASSDSSHLIAEEQQNAESNEEVREETVSDPGHDTQSQDNVNNAASTSKDTTEQVIEQPEITIDASEYEDDNGDAVIDLDGNKASLDESSNNEKEEVVIPDDKITNEESIDTPPAEVAVENATDADDKITNEERIDTPPAEVAVENATDAVKSDPVKDGKEKPAPKGSLADFFVKAKSKASTKSSFQQELEVQEKVASNIASHMNSKPKEKQYQGEPWGYFRPTRRLPDLQLLYMLFHGMHRPPPGRTEVQQLMEQFQQNLLFDANLIHELEMNAEGGWNLFDGKDSVDGKERADTVSDSSLDDLDKALPNKASDVNSDFVEGLDDIDKFFEGVDPPDELDVGASGTSIQEVLMGKGKQILVKKLKQLSHAIQSGWKKLRSSVGNLFSRDDEEQDSDSATESFLERFQIKELPMKIWDASKLGVETFMSFVDIIIDKVESFFEKDDVDDDEILDFSSVMQ